MQDCKSQTGTEIITEVKTTLRKSEPEIHSAQPAAGVYCVGTRWKLFCTVKYSAFTNEKTKLQYHIVR